MTTTPAHTPRPGNYRRGPARKTIVSAVKASGIEGVTYADLRNRYSDQFSESQIKSVLHNCAHVGELVNLHSGQPLALYVHSEHADAARAEAAKPRVITAPGFTYATNGPTIGRRHDPAASSTRYTGAELAPQQNRPAGNDFLRHPSRHGRHLVWRDGRTALIGEASTNASTNAPTPRA